MYGANPKNIKRRFIVPPSLASWDEDFPDYKPIEYTNEMYCEPNRAVLLTLKIALKLNSTIGMKQIKPTVIVISQTIESKFASTMVDH